MLFLSNKDKSPSRLVCLLLMVVFCYKDENSLPGRDTFGQLSTGWNCMLVRMLVIITLEVRACGSAHVTLTRPRALKYIESFSRAVEFSS